MTRGANLQNSRRHRYKQENRRVWATLRRQPTTLTVHALVLQCYTNIPAVRTPGLSNADHRQDKTIYSFVQTFVPTNAHPTTTTTPSSLAKGCTNLRLTSPQTPSTRRILNRSGLPRLQQRGHAAKRFLSRASTVRCCAVPRSSVPQHPSPAELHHRSPRLVRRLRVN